MKIKELYDDDESKWTKGTYARDDKGFPASAIAPDATAWCLLGAIRKCYQENLQNGIALKIAQALEGRNISIWNDDPNRTFADVKKLVEELDI